MAKNGLRSDLGASNCKKKYLEGCPQISLDPVHLKHIFIIQSPNLLPPLVFIDINMTVTRRVAHLSNMQRHNKGYYTWPSNECRIAQVLFLTSADTHPAFVQI